MPVRASVLAVLLAFFSSSCVIALEVTEEDAHEARLHLGHGRRVHAEDDERCVLGRVLDASGQPVRARVAAVYASGSYSTETGDGRYELGPLPRGRFHLTVSDDQGRVAVLEDLRIRDDERLEGVDVTLEEQGGKLSFSFEGGSRERYRVAVFHAGRRVEDFTLRRGETAEAVVPAGTLPVQLYADDAVWGAREVRVEPGGTASVVFEPGG